MCSLESFKIDLKGLKDGDTCFSFNLGDDYFTAIDAQEVSKGDVNVELTIHRTGERYFDLDFHIAGEVTVQCDRCLDDMSLPVDTEHRLVAKFGEEYSEDDDLVTVAEDDGELDTAWFIYEFIALSLPLKHVHEPGKCNSAMIKTLEEHSAAKANAAESQAVDPRWSGLLKIKESKE